MLKNAVAKFARTVNTNNEAIRRAVLKWKTHYCFFYFVLLCLTNNRYKESFVSPIEWYDCSIMLSCLETLDQYLAFENETNESDPVMICSVCNKKPAVFVNNPAICSHAHCVDCLSAWWYTMDQQPGYWMLPLYQIKGPCKKCERGMTFEWMVPVA